MISIAHPLLGVEAEEAVLRVLASGQLAQGEHVAAFEQRFAEVCHVQEAVAVSSGMAALHLALLAHDIGPGDEVITTAFSFAATANVILLVGATPVFVDNVYTTTTWNALRSLTGVSEGTMTRLKVQKVEPLRLGYEDVIAALLNDTIPTVTGEDGVAVLKVVLQLTEPANEEGIKKQGTKVALETGVEVET